MSAPSATVDRLLHLSLPDWRTALKKRVKRPRRPNWFWVGFTLAYIGLAVWSFVIHAWVCLGADTGAIGYGWWAVVNHQPKVVWKYYGFVIIGTWVPIVVNLVKL